MRREHVVAVAAERLEVLEQPAVVPRLLRRVVGEVGHEAGRDRNRPARAPRRAREAASISGTAERTIPCIVARYTG